MPLMMDHNSWPLGSGTGPCRTTNSSPSPSSSSITSVSDANGCHKRRREQSEDNPRKKNRITQKIDYPSSFSLRPRCYQRQLLPIHKGRTVPSSAAGLSRELWLKVFEYLPPKDLGRLMRVNQAFTSWLTYSVPFCSDHQQDHASLGHTLDAETIWRQARRRTHGHLPRPLHSFTELEMWRLIGGQRCEVCLRSPEAISMNNYWETPSSRSSPEPEPRDIQIYWSIGVRICRDCFHKIAKRAQDLQMDPELLSCLPSVEHAEDQDRWHIKEHVDLLRTQLHESSLQSFDEFRARIQSLKAIAVKHGRDARRWQDWEAAQRVTTRHMQPSFLPSFTPVSRKSKKQKEKQRKLNHANEDRRAEITRCAAQLNPPVPWVVSEQLPAYRLAVQNPWTLPEVEWKLLRERLRSQSRVHAETPQEGFPPLAQQSTVNRNEVIARRCAEIARRAIRLDPPVSKEVLDQLPVYQAAHNVPRDLIEAEWPIMRDRLLAQARQFQTSKQDTAVALPLYSNRLDSTTSTFVPPGVSTGESRASRPNQEGNGFAREDTVKSGCPKKRITTDKLAAPVPTSSDSVVRSSSEASLSISATASDTSTAALLATSRAHGNDETLVSWPSSSLNAMNINPPRTEPAQALHSGTPQMNQQDVTTTKQKIEYLAAKLQAIGKHILPISTLSVEMRTVVVLCRAISQYKSRYNEEPSVDLILQTLYIADNLVALKIKHSLFCGLCPPGTFTSSGRTGTTTSLAQSIILLVLHYDIQHVDRPDRAATLQRGQVSDFWKALIALPDRKMIEAKIELTKNTTMTTPAILKICEDILLYSPDRLRAIVNPSSSSPLERVSRSPPPSTTTTIARPQSASSAARNVYVAPRDVDQIHHATAIAERPDSLCPSTLLPHSSDACALARPSPTSPTAIRMLRAGAAHTASGLLASPKHTSQTQSSIVERNPYPRVFRTSPEPRVKLEPENYARAATERVEERQQEQLRLGRHSRSPTRAYSRALSCSPYHAPHPGADGREGVGGGDPQQNAAHVRQASVPQYATSGPQPQCFMLYDAYGRQYKAVPNEAYPLYDRYYYSNGSP